MRHPCVIEVRVWHTCGMVVNRDVWHRWGMAREDLHFRLRIPERLKKRVEASAANNHRSMTAEIVEALEQQFPEPPPLDERLTDLLATLGLLAAKVEGETPESILSGFTEKLIETLSNIESGVWGEVDNRTKQIASAALAKLKKGD